MLKITCDRCGTELQTIDDAVALRIVADAFATREKRGPAGQYELCPSCALRVMGFIEGERATENYIDPRRRGNEDTACD